MAHTLLTKYQITISIFLGIMWFMVWYVTKWSHKHISYWYKLIYWRVIWYLVKKSQFGYINWMTMQWKPLNVITLERRETDHIIWTITISYSTSFIPTVYTFKSVYGPLPDRSHKTFDTIISDHIKQLALLYQWSY